MTSRGQVQVDIVADVTKFLADAQKKLNAEIKKLKLRPVPVEIDPQGLQDFQLDAIPVQIDTEQALADLEDLKPQIEVDVESAVKKIKPIPVPVTVDAEPLAEAVEEALKDKPVKVDLDEDAIAEPAEKAAFRMRTIFEDTSTIIRAGWRRVATEVQGQSTSYLASLQQIRTAWRAIGTEVQGQSAGFAGSLDKVRSAWRAVGAEIRGDNLKTVTAFDGIGPRIGAQLKMVWGRFREDGISAVGKVASGIASGIGSAISGTFSGIASAIGPVGSAIGTALVAGMAPVLAGGVSAALTLAAALGIGGAIAAVGAIALKENERLVDQFEKTAKTIKDVFAEAAQPLIEPFAEALTEVRTVVNGLKPSLKNLFAGIAPSVQILSKALRGTLTPVIQGLEKAMPGINSAFSGLAKILPSIGEAVGKFFETIFADGPVLETLIKNMGRFITWLIGIAGPAVRGFTVIFGAFGNAIRLALNGSAFAWEALQRAFDGGTGAIERITTAWAPLEAAIRAVWGALADFAAADTDEELAASVIRLVATIKAAWGPLKEFLGVVWEEVWAFIKRIWDEKVVPWWNGTAKPFIDKEIKGFFSRAFNDMVNAALSALLTLPLRIPGALASVGSAVQGALAGAFGGAASWLFSAGSSIVQGLINGISSKIGALVSMVSRLGALIVANKGPESYDRVMLRPAGRLIVDGLVAGLASREDALVQQVQRLSRSISTYPMGAGGGDGAELLGTPGPGLRVWGGQQAQVPTLVIASDGRRHSDLMVQEMSKAVRVRGGVVQKVLGKTSVGVN